MLNQNMSDLKQTPYTICTMLVFYTMLV